MLPLIDSGGIKLLANPVAALIINSKKLSTWRL